MALEGGNKWMPERKRIPWLVIREAVVFGIGGAIGGVRNQWIAIDEK